MGKRQEAALETRKKIIDAMTEILREQAADSISIEDITNKAGVAKGSFYTYFKRKEDLISIIADECYALVKKNVMNSSADIYKQLCDYLKNSVLIINKNSLQIAQNWMKSVTAPLTDEEGGIKKYNYDKENIIEILKKAVDKKELNENMPIDIIAENIINNYYGAVAVWCITKGNSDLIENMNNFCSYWLKTMIEQYRNREDL